MTFIRLNGMVINAACIVMAYERETRRGKKYLVKVREGSIVNEYEVSPYEYDKATKLLTKEFPDPRSNPRRAINHESWER